jgi:GntR family transcriptional regulator
MEAAQIETRGSRQHSARWLRDLLRSALLAGRFEADGRMLPGEAQLMLAYGVPRATVREALDLLRREGLVERQQGTGTRCVARRESVRLVEAHGTAEDRSHPMVGGVRPRVIEQRTVPMPPAVARYLGERAGAPCLLLEYVALVLGEPHAVCANYVRYPEAERVAATAFGADWYTLMADAGLVVAETDFVIEAMLADRPVADLLGIPVGAPVMALEQVIRDATGRPYDFAVIRSRGDRAGLLSRAVPGTLV